MHLKVGTISGTPIMGRACMDKARARDVAGLSNGALDGLIITDRLGATGYNLVAANHVIFLGSLYSATMECQAIGMILVDKRI
jgi:hypothetical protein